MKRQVSRDGRKKRKSDAFREDAGEKDERYETNRKKSGADHKASDEICISKVRILVFYRNRTYLCGSSRECTGNDVYEESN